MTQPIMPLDQLGAKRTGKHSGGRQQLYFLDDPGRKLILAKYDGTTEVTDELARRLRVPRWKIKRWASDLGLSRPQNHRYWTKAEEEYLEANLGRIGFDRMALTLGRTKTSVRLKAKRLGVNQTQEGYTMRGLCLALGCDHHKVARWIKNGWLKGTRRW
jgi:hypothetical protein